MADTVKDPVCGKEMSPDEAAAREETDGRTLYFCSEDCHTTFMRDPYRYGQPLV